MCVCSVVGCVCVAVWIMAVCDWWDRQQQLPHLTSPLTPPVEAENILGFERELVALPGGLPTPASLDEARMRHEEARRLNKVHEVFI